MGKESKAVIVTTEWRGVFFGLASGEADDRCRIKLKEARNVIYWTQEVNGFGGLAVTGPTDGCRIGPAVPEIELAGVTSVLTCSEKAKKTWAARK